MYHSNGFGWAGRDAHRALRRAQREGASRVRIIIIIIIMIIIIIIVTSNW